MRTFLLFLIALGTAQAQTTAIQAAPSWSPDTKSVCYVSEQTGNADIYILHVQTGEKLKLTDTPTEEWTPAWSPDGTKIAYVSNRDGNKELYCYNLASKVHARLTDTPGDEIMPSWSPDSKIVVHAYTPPNSPNKIRSITLDGITTDLTPNLEHTYIYPSISLNGQYLLYSTRPATGNDRFHVAIFDLNTKKETQLEEMGFVSYNPSWACEGNEIIFINQQHREIKSASVYRMAMDGSSLEKLLSCEGGCFQARVSKDCGQLAYRNGWKEHHKGIYVLDLATQTNTKLIAND